VRKEKGQISLKLAIPYYNLHNRNIFFINSMLQIDHLPFHQITMLLERFPLSNFGIVSLTIDSKNPEKIKQA
jgi:hypothetical protein